MLIAKIHPVLLQMALIRMGISCFAFLDVRPEVAIARRWIHITCSGRKRSKVLETSDLEF